MACSLIQFGDSEITYFTFNVLCLNTFVIQEYCFAMYPADFFLIHADLVTDMITESGQLSFLYHLFLFSSYLPRGEGWNCDLGVKL